MSKDPLKNTINVIIEDLGHLSKNVARGYGAIQPTVRTSRPSLGDVEAEDSGRVREITPVKVSRAFLKAKAEDQINESDTDKKIMLSIIENIISEVLTGHEAGAGISSSSGGSGESSIPDELSGGSEDYAIEVKSLQASEAHIFNRLMAGIKNHELCMAILVNAKAESRLSTPNPGDCKTKEAQLAHYKSAEAVAAAVPVKNKPGQVCCSWGYWQFNICRGLGRDLLRSAGRGDLLKGDNPEGVRDFFKNGDAQIDFIINLMVNGGKAGNTTIGPQAQIKKSTHEWIDWFVKNIERPKNPNHSVVSRQAMARNMATSTIKKPPEPQKAKKHAAVGDTLKKPDNEKLKPV